ncbi:hypothetical protein, partial [Paracoccus rhizosphaerae]
MRQGLTFIENNLLLLPILTNASGLLVPSFGISLEVGISPLLALLMLVISLTFDAKTVQIVFLRCRNGACAATRSLPLPRRGPVGAIPVLDPTGGLRDEAVCRTG